jgi:hypothetical protein
MEPGSHPAGAGDVVSGLALDVVEAIYDEFRLLEGRHGPADNARRRELWRALDRARALERAPAPAPPIAGGSQDARVCAACGRPIGGRPDRRTCSARCRQRLARAPEAARGALRGVTGAEGDPNVVPGVSVTTGAHP